MRFSGKASRPISVIDIGSNSIKVLVAERGAWAGSVETVFANTLEVRISGGIGAGRAVLGAEAMARALEAVRTLQSEAAAFEPAVTVITATAAVRYAENGAAFRDNVEASTGLRCHILSGDDEALGIARGVRCDPGLQGSTDALLQIDLGGGSLELVHSKASGVIDLVSLPLGAVRMLELFVPDPNAAIPPEARVSLRSFIRQLLASCPFRFPLASVPAVGTGGAFTIARAMVAGEDGQTLAESSPLLSRTTLEGLGNRLAGLPLEERLTHPALPRQRADILPVALLTIAFALEYANIEQIHHSFYNLRYGVADLLLRRLENGLTGQPETIDFASTAEAGQPRPR